VGVPLTHLADATTAELDELAAGVRRALLVPLGATEQHGPHLPLDTDTRVAVAVAELAACRWPDQVVVAPAVPYGSSGEHAGFAGTLSIGQAALELLLVELGRSVGPPFDALVLVNGHGGNAAPLGRAVRALQGEGRDVLAWSPGLRGPGVDAHAGRTETSLVLALAPDRVRAERAEAGDRRPLPLLIDELRRSGVRAVSPNGVLGDPGGASAEEGRALLEALADDLAAVVAVALTHPSRRAGAAPGAGLA
jgi:creatinine amidohydrolase